MDSCTAFLVCKDEKKCEYIDCILNISEGNNRYKEILADKKRISNMYDVAQRVKDIGIEMFRWIMNDMQFAKQ